MNINAAFPSKYLKAADLEGQPADLTIKSVTLEEVDDEETRPVLHFAEAERGLVLNRTNAAVIADALGEETDDWSGRRLTVFPDKTTFKGKLVDCLRVRVPQQATTPDAPKPRKL